MSALGQKQTSAVISTMSALPLKSRHPLSASFIEMSLGSPELRFFESTFDFRNRVGPGPASPISGLSLRKGCDSHAPSSGKTDRADEIGETIHTCRDESRLRCRPA